MTAAELADYLDRYAGSFDAPVIEHDSAVRRLAPRRRRLRRRAPTDGAWRARNVVIATGWCDQPARPGRRRAPRPRRSPRSTPSALPQPRPAPRRRRARRRRLGHRRAARRRARPRRPRRRARRRPPQPAAPPLPRHGHLLVARPDRHASTGRSTRCADPAAARREPSLQLVGRPDHRDVDLAAAPAPPACELAGRLDRRRRHRRPLRRRPRRAPSPPPTSGCAGSSAEIDAHIDATGLAAEVLDPDPRRPVAAGGAPDRRSTCAPRGIATVVWATGYRRALPVAARARPRRARRDRASAAASRRSPGCTCSASASSTAATRTSSTASAATPPSSPTTSPAAPPVAAPAGSPADRTETDHAPRTATRYDVVVVGARAAGAATAMLLARAGLDVLVVDRSRYGADTLSTHALMRGGVLQLHRWGLLDAHRRRRHPAGAPHDVPLRRRRRVGHRIKPVARRRRALRAAAHRARPDPRRRGRRRPAPTSATASPSPTSRRDARRPGRRRRRPRRRRPAASRVDAALRDRRRRAPLDRRPRASAPRSSARGTGATAVVYGYWSGLDTDGYEWIFRPDACAGVIPTNDGQACVFAARHARPASAAAASTCSRDVVADGVARPRPTGSRGGAARPACARFGGLPGYLRRPWGPGWALVGDAGYWKDPISAHGLTDALRDAELLARAVVAAATGDEPRAATRSADYQAHPRPAVAAAVRRRRRHRRPCAGPTPRSPPAAAAQRGDGRRGRDASPACDRTSPLTIGGRR